MLDLKFIQNNVELVRKNIQLRRSTADVDKVIRLAQERRQRDSKLQEMRAEQRLISNAVAEAPTETKSNLAEEGRALRPKIEELDKSLQRISAELQEELFKIPNMSHPEAPVGESDQSNREVYRSSEPTQFSFKPLDHVGLGKALDILDFEGGTKVAGRNFYFLKNEGVLLELALINFAVDMLRRHGFTLHITPDLAFSEILDGIGYSPRGAETQIYSIAGTDLCLIATAEIPLGGVHQNTVLAEEFMPLKYAGLSHCFRTEAGSYGKASRGLYRVHQFTKVEMFIFCKPEESEIFLQRLVEIEKEYFQLLGIPFRVVECCTGDLGGPAYRKFDLEAWMPGRGETGEWGEITSASNCTDYQARRLNVKYKGSQGKTHFIHTLNATAVATSRTLLSILENYQESDGSVRVPKVLESLVGFSRIQPKSGQLK